MAKGDIERVNGDNLLYRLFLNLLDGDDAVSAPLIDAMIRATAIWFPPQIYSQLPVLLPWVVRDPACRPRTVAGKRTPDEWSSPNTDGYLRDDNSLIKNIPKSLEVVGPPESPLRGSLLGNAFVASHVWREVNLEDLASRDPRLNSFVPNLVWLPKQIAKLSDREGGKMQEALKRTSWALYRHAAVRDHLQNTVEDIWKLIPEPAAGPTIDPAYLNFFQVTDKFVASRLTSLREVIQLCRSVLDETPLQKTGRISTRYFEKLPTLEKHVVGRFWSQIALYDSPG